MKLVNDRISRSASRIQKVYTVGCGSGSKSFWYFRAPSEIVRAVKAHILRKIVMTPILIL